MNKIIHFICGISFFFLLSCDHENKTTSVASEVKDSIAAELANRPEPSIDLTIPDKDSIDMDSSEYKWKDDHIVIDWQMLGKVIYEDRYNEEVDTLIPYPVFHPSLHKLDKQRVHIKGYVLPLSEDDGKLHIISSNPMSTCFFCGGAGPESVMDVMTVEAHTSFEEDAIITFSGTLFLNDEDVQHMIYILKNAEIVKD